MTCCGVGDEVEMSIQMAVRTINEIAWYKMNKRQTWEQIQIKWCNAKYFSSISTFHPFAFPFCLRFIPLCWAVTATETNPVIMCLIPPQEFNSFSLLKAAPSQGGTCMDSSIRKPPSTPVVLPST